MNTDGCVRMMLARKLSRHHKMLLGLLVFLIVLVEIHLIYRLVTLYAQPDRQSLAAGQLPPAVFQQHRFFPWKYVHNVQQEVAGGTVILQKPSAKESKGPLLKWQSTFKNNSTSYSTDGGRGSNQSRLSSRDRHFFRASSTSWSS